MAGSDVTVVLAHGAWAGGSSWARVIAALEAIVTAPAAVADITRDAVRAASGA